MQALLLSESLGGRSECDLEASSSVLDDSWDLSSPALADPPEATAGSARAPGPWAQCGPIQQRAQHAQQGAQQAQQGAQQAQRAVLRELLGVVLGQAGPVLDNYRLDVQVRCAVLRCAVCAERRPHAASGSGTGACRGEQAQRCATCGG